MKQISQSLYWVKIAKAKMILAGYVLSRRYLYWRNFIMFSLSLTMLFNGGLIPFFMVVRALGFINTPFAIIIPGTVSVFNILIMRTAFFGLPESLEESAKMDDAGHFSKRCRVGYNSGGSP